MAESGASRVLVERLGRTAAGWVEEFGYYFALCAESLYWLVAGPFRHQPVRLGAAVAQMAAIGLSALPILVLLSFAIGVMLAIQGIHTLQQFGAETQVVLGIALSVTREFGPLITAILIAGRSGSALAARIGSMQINQEIDALRVMGIEPVRFLAAPVLLALLVMVPCLSFVADLAALAGGSVYCKLGLGLGYVPYWDAAVKFVDADDVYQGLLKSLVFALVIGLVGLSNGFNVTGGAEGVGRATTRAVVLAISYVVVFDMLFTYFLNR
ncbi:MAG: ABC transporter permease [Gammaproteobacteria bacterium]|nr:ABC transporter permease [Gammaproteobacteria bacterium]MBI5615380.1 ABC transporter permease [Gammaproteobacteria bacterium]